ncbi:MAG: hypothetical protein ACJ77M_12590 [Thermoleophilaceae bacterium]
MRWPAVVLVPLALLAFAPTALGFVEPPTSHIDSPAGPIYSFYGLGGVPNEVGDSVPVHGTVVNFPTSTVDLNCYFGGSSVWNTLASDVPVDSGDQSFSATVDATGLGFDCFLRAVPHNGSLSDLSLSPPTGPVIAPTGGSDSTVSTGPNTGKRYDYDYTFNGSQGSFEVNSPGDQGILNSSLVDAATAAYAPKELATNVLALFAYNSDPTATRSEIEVDGGSAYTPFAAAAAFGSPDGANHFDAPGLRSISVTHESFDESTGAATITTSSPILECSPSTDFDQNRNHYATSCTHYVSTGLVLDRSLVSGADGQTLRVTDTWRNTSASAHTLDALYDSRFNGDLPKTGSFRFPGTSSFTDYPQGSVIPLPAGPGTMYYKSDHNSSDSGGDGEPQGALSWSVPPSEFKFIFSDQQGGPPQWTMEYPRTIPARSSVTFAFQLDQAVGQSALQGFGQAFESEFALPTSPGSPPGSQSVAPGNGPPLGGNQAITTAPPLTIVGDAALKLGKASTKWLGSIIVVDTGEQGTCPAGGGTCTFDLLATIPGTQASGAAKKKKAKLVTIGKASVKVAPGKTGKLTFKLSKRWTKLLVSKHSLRIALTLTAKSPAHAAKKATRTIKVNAPKPPGRKKH